MALAPVGLSRQQVTGVRCDVTFETAGIADGLQFGVIPAGSFVLGVVTDVTTAFNAATTNVLTVGTSTTGTEICDASALAETAGSQIVAPIAAFACARTADTPLYVKYTQTGTVADAGAATIVVLYIPNLPSFTPAA